MKNWNNYPFKKGSYEYYFDQYFDPIPDHFLKSFVEQTSYKGRFRKETFVNITQRLSTGHSQNFKSIQQVLHSFLEGGGAYHSNYNEIEFYGGKQPQIQLINLVSGTIDGKK